MRREVSEGPTWMAGTRAVVKLRERKGIRCVQAAAGYQSKPNIQTE